MSSFYEFMRRQFLIGRIHATRYWLWGMALTAITQVGFWGGLIAAVVGLATGATWTGWFVASTLGLYAISLCRGMLRNQLGKIVCSDWKHYKKAKRFDTLFAPVVGMFVMSVFIVSAFGRKICWRGNYYSIASDGRCQFLGRKVTEQAWKEINGQTDKTQKAFEQHKNEAERAA